MVPLLVSPVCSFVYHGMYVGASIESSEKLRTRLVVETRRLSSPRRSDRRLPKFRLRDGTCSRKQLLHLVLLLVKAFLLLTRMLEAKRPYQLLMLGGRLLREKKNWSSASGLILIGGGEKYNIELCLKCKLFLLASSG